VFAEFMCGSRRLANQMARFQWHTLSVDNGSKKINLEEPPSLDDPDKPGKLRRIKPDEVHPDLFAKAKKPLHIHVEGNFEDIPIERFPLIDVAHMSPDCRSMSVMAVSHHPRSEVDRMLATGTDASPAGVAWDGIVSYYRDFVRLQRRKENNTHNLGFLLEQPWNPARVGRHAQIELMTKPIPNGGDGGELIRVDQCAMGIAWVKSLGFVIGGLDELVKELKEVGSDGERKFICPGASRLHTHYPVRGNAQKSTAFDENLARIFALGINRSRPLPRQVR
jgi:hypothetical protein